MLYDADGGRAGYATSYVYSPHAAVAHRHRAGATRARRRPAHRLGVEQTVNHIYTTAPGTVTTLPFFNPERKTSMT